MIRDYFVEKKQKAQFLFDKILRGKIAIFL